jgi:hypothetical protein
MKRSKDQVTTEYALNDQESSRLGVLSVLAIVGIIGLVFWFVFMHESA